MKISDIEGDIELAPDASRASTITLTTDLDLWRMLDAYVANRQALTEANATGHDTEPISETADDLANGITTAVLNAAGEGQ